MDGTSGFRLFYMFERTPIEYFTVINTTQTENFGMVEFKPYADGKSDFTLGKSSSCYRFEVVNSNRSAPISPVGSISTNESETNHSSLTDYLSYNDSFKQEIKCT